jgi:hypothetical protein
MVLIKPAYPICPLFLNFKTYYWTWLEKIWALIDPYLLAYASNLFILNSKEPSFPPKMKAEFNPRMEI